MCENKCNECSGMGSCKSDPVDQEPENSRKRDYDRKQLLVALAIAWDKNPNLRLCQLISDVIDTENFFWVNDAVLLGKLEDFKS